MTGEVSALEHDVGNHTVEGTACVSLCTRQSVNPSTVKAERGSYVAVLTSCQFAEVPGRLGNGIIVQLTTPQSASCLPVAAVAVAAAVLVGGGLLSVRQQHVTETSAAAAEGERTRRSVQEDCRQQRHRSRRWTWQLQWNK